MEGARLAEPADLDAVEAVVRAATPEVRDARGGPLLLALDAEAGPIRDRVQRALDDDRGRVVVGTYADVVLGLGLGWTRLLPDGRPLGVIEVLVVDPEARGAGIGEAMMNLLLDRFRADGCIGVDCRALPGDRNTKNFFESFGLKARLLTVHLALGSAE